MGTTTIKQRKYLYLVMLLAVMVIVSGPAGPVRGATVKIGGTGFGLGVMTILAHRFENSHPGQKIEVLPSLGSAGGINALLHGALDLAVSGRPLKPGEMDRGITATVFTRTPFVFIVNQSVAQRGITHQELEKIFRGEMRAWPGGERIRPVLRPAGDTMTKMTKGISPEMNRAMTLALARDGMIMAITDQESVQLVEKIPGALAASSLTQVYSENRRVGILSFNGVAPSVRALRDGTYPLSVSLYLVTSDRMEKTARDFIRFLYTATGRSVLSEYGNLVVAPPGNHDQ